MSALNDAAVNSLSYAAFRDVTATGVEAVVTHPSALNEPGFYVVVATFEGEFLAARMRDVQWHPERGWAGWSDYCATTNDATTKESAESPSGAVPGERRGPAAWSTSMDQTTYEAAVTQVREAVAAGDVYQANICRVLSRPLGSTDLDAVFTGILSHNPAQHAARIRLQQPQHGLDVDVASASPELFLRRDGRRIASAPIKGTAPTADAMLAKDRVENIMITDLVRNDLQTVCDPGTVAVDGLLQIQQHPGLVHLVSTVVGQLRDGCGWSEIFAGTFPPGSVSGAPKSSAVRIIDTLETTARGPYCGALGWVYTPANADAEPQAELAVGIRTFWRSLAPAADRPEQVTSPKLLFGAGAGITYDSDPSSEWIETELKARKLLQIADRVTGSRRNHERPNLG